MEGKIPAKFACEYQPIIEDLERGEDLLGTTIDKDFYSEGKEWEENLHPAVQQFLKEAREKFKVDYICISGLKDLQIYEVPDDTVVKIKCFDGSESVKLDYSGYF